MLRADKPDSHNTKKGSGQRPNLFLCCDYLPYYSPGMIASLGQTSAQLPQSMQVSGLIL